MYMDISYFFWKAWRFTHRTFAINCENDWQEADWMWSDLLTLYLLNDQELRRLPGLGKGITPLCFCDMKGGVYIKYSYYMSASLFEILMLDHCYEHWTRLLSVSHV